MAERRRLTTWNVLHRVHAVNWKEAPVLAFPDERVRIERIAGKVAAWLADDVDVVCLQEVSGDQLASLRRAVGASVAVFEHRYPRMPVLRVKGPPVLEDASEHLVTIVKDRGAHQVDARTFATDPGKGLLAVSVGDAVVINTHVSFGERRAEQLATLASVAREAPDGAIVLGDFNATAAVVAAPFGAGVAISDLAGQGPTRIATDEHPSYGIDHVVAVHVTITSAAIIASDGLSDHNPVTAIVRGRYSPEA
jgi:endonuclease/exonuclease/phosphatase family metal-dependent hydrolase